MKVLIIEDEAPAFRRLQKIIEELIPDVEIVDVLDSVEESIKWFNNHKHPDLIFMDIQLSDGISFEIFDQVKINKPVIFTTAFDEYMLKAFKVNSIDYLLKPIKKEDLDQSLQKFKELNSQISEPENAVNIHEVVKQIRLAEKQHKSRYLVKQADKMISVEVDNIVNFFTRRGVVHIVTNTNKKYLLDFSLDELMEQLDPEKFYRANRQFIVHFKYIETVHKYHKGKLLVEMNPQSDEEIIVSAEKATDFKNWMGN